MGFHNKAAPPLTVTELAYGVDATNATSWTPICSCTVEADEAKVTLVGACYRTDANEMAILSVRGVYNGVEKFLVESSLGYWVFVFGRWSGNGLGFGATASVESKQTDITGSKGRGGVIYGAK